MEKKNKIMDEIKNYWPAVSEILIGLILSNLRENVQLVD